MQPTGYQQALDDSDQLCSGFHPVESTLGTAPPLRRPDLNRAVALDY